MFKSRIRAKLVKTTYLNSSAESTAKKSHCNFFFNLGSWFRASYYNITIMSNMMSQYIGLF
jgi:hypothetical protein